MVLTITEEQRELLESILIESLAEVRDEIYRTEHFEFKEKLKARKTIIEQLLEKIRAKTAVDTHTT